MDSQKRVLLSLARSAISEVLCIPHTLDFEQLRKENPWLEDECASFVTITIDNGKLRGCIGSLISHGKLYIDVMLNAKSAAMNDPRFPSLSVKEFEDIK